MIKIVFLLLVIGFIYFALQSLFKKPPAFFSHAIKTLSIVLLVLLLVYLLATGRLNGLFALVGMLIALLIRFIPLLLKMLPLLHGLLKNFTSFQANHTKQQRSASSQSMTTTEALDVLGLKFGASKPEIIAAHRRLMLKVHPDRGGSNYLATKLNLAKKILLAD